METQKIIELQKKVAELKEETSKSTTELKVLLYNQLLGQLKLKTGVIIAISLLLGGFIFGGMATLSAQASLDAQTSFAPSTSPSLPSFIPFSIIIALFSGGMAIIGFDYYMFKKEELQKTLLTSVFIGE